MDERANSGTSETTGGRVAILAVAMIVVGVAALMEQDFQEEVVEAHCCVHEANLLARSP
jgi:hypothetical protein